MKTLVAVTFMAVLYTSGGGFHWGLGVTLGPGVRDNGSDDNAGAHDNGTVECTFGDSSEDNVDSFFTF